MSPSTIQPAATPQRGLVLPQDYDPILNLRQTEDAIKRIKDTFQVELAQALNLSRVTAPFFVGAGTGINDHLSCKEKPASFVISDMDVTAEIVQSLAKWKRLALGRYGFQHGEGLYTDMNAIRPDETLDNLHSIYVDQWDWERVISEQERSIPFLQRIVGSIYEAIRRTEQAICSEYPMLAEPWLPPSITFVHAEELQAQYPDLLPAEREDAACREHGAVFLIGIGAPLADGYPHDDRAADYDDWCTPTMNGYHGLNGDILVWNSVLDRSFELSSMGIRVSPESLRTQLALKGEESKLGYFFHQQLVEGKLPLTIGGGIGQSRLCMLLLRRAHVGEVQASVWPEEMVKICEENRIFLL